MVELLKSLAVGIVAFAALAGIAALWFTYPKVFGGALFIGGLVLMGAGVRGLYRTFRRR